MNFIQRGIMGDQDVVQNREHIACSVDFVLVRLEIYNPSISDPKQILVGFRRQLVYHHHIACHP